MSKIATANTIIYLVRPKPGAVTTDAFERSMYNMNTVQINNPNGVAIHVYTSNDGEGSIGDSNWTEELGDVDISTAGTHKLVFMGKLGYIGATVADASAVTISCLSGMRDTA